MAHSSLQIMSRLREDTHIVMAPRVLKWRQLILAVAVALATVPATATLAPPHLRWSSVYDTSFPAGRGWINMGLSVYRESWPGGCVEHASGPTGCGLQAKLGPWSQCRSRHVL
jgi:hypothetical protein